VEAPASDDDYDDYGYDMMMMIKVILVLIKNSMTEIKKLC